MCGRSAVGAIHKGRPHERGWDSLTKCDSHIYVCVVEKCGQDAGVVHKFPTKK